MFRKTRHAKHLVILVFLISHVMNLYSDHRPLKIRTDVVHARVRKLGSSDFSTPQRVLYGITLVWNNVWL